MQHRLRQLITESRILKSALIFFLAYLILLVLWIQVRETYGYVITLVASKFVAEVKDVQLGEVTKGGKVIYASFRSSKRGKDLPVIVPVRIDTYTSTLPLTLSILASLSFFIRRKKKAYTEALLMLFFFHLLHVFLEEILQLTKVFMTKGIEKESLIRLSVYHFLWGATKYASMSFAPFLLVTYIFVRFRK